MLNDKDSNIIAKGIVKAVFSLLAILFLVWFLYKIETVIIYLISAFIVSLIGRPVKKFLIKRFKMKDSLAAAVTLFIFIIFFGSLFSAFVPMIYEQGRNLSLLDFNQFQKQMEELIANLNLYLQNKNIHLLENFSLDKIFSKINLSVIPQLINSVLGIIGNFVIGLFAVTFISFFLLQDSNLATQFLFKFIPDNDIDRYKRLIDNIKTLLSRYFIGLFLQVLILFVFYTIMLNIVGVQNSALIALLAALLNLIPYIGPIIGWSLTITLSLTSSINHMPMDQIIILIRNITIGYLLVQLWDNFVNQPLIFSKSVKAHPLEIFLVILIAGNLFGIMGMIVAVPLYTMFRLLFKEFYQEYKTHFTIW
jgi:predicted PurR-regulated permease PerM